MRKNVLVTAVGGRSVGSGILHALTRNTPEVNDRWNVVAADADSFSWGLYKVDQHTRLPFASSANYIDEVKKVVKDFKIHAILPGSEAEAEKLAQNKGQFDIPIVTNSLGLMPLMMDKFKATQKLIELGLPTIPTYPVEDYEKALADFDFPFIIKPTIGTGGSKGVTLCSNLSELQNKLSQLPENSGYCIQPLIGSEDNEYTVGILSDKSGKLIDSIVMKRKLLGLSLLDSKKVGSTSYSISTGYSQGFFIKDAPIQDFCENLSRNLGSTGPLNIQLRVHKEEIFVFEIHPRFSGTTTMRADVGFNEPDIMLRNYLSGEDFSRINYQYNVAAIRAFEHVIVPIDQMI
jgi:carbamoyl-phosphate synthase large subunit